MYSRCTSSFEQMYLTSGIVKHDPLKTGAAWEFGMLVVDGMCWIDKPVVGLTEIIFGLLRSMNNINNMVTYIPQSAAYMRQWTGSASVQVMASHQAITWTNLDLLLIERVGTNFGQIRIKRRIFSFMKIHMKISSAKRAAVLSLKDKLTWNILSYLTA